MKVSQQGHNILLTPTTPQETAICGIIAKRTPWVWSRLARAWVIPVFALSGLPPKVREVLPLYPPPARPQTDPFLLAQLPTQAEPYPFQAEQCLNMISGNWGLWMDAGVGKTITTLCAYYLLRHVLGQVDGMVVVGPEASRHVWVGPQSESARWIGEPDGRYIESGSSAPPEPEGIVCITGAKVFRHPYHGWITSLLRTGRWILCLDEVQDLAGAMSKRREVLDLWGNYSKWVWALSATPVRNYPDSFWGVYRLLTGDPVALHTWIEWFKPGRSRTARWRQDRLEALNGYLQHCTSTIKKVDVAPWLPPVTTQVISVPLVGKQKKLYGEAVGIGRQYLAETWAPEKDHRVLSQMSALTSLASHPLIRRDTQWKDSDIAKLPILQSLISAAGEQKVLIWSWHPGVLNWLMGFYPGKGVRYHGGVGQAEREEAVYKFQQDPNTTLFFGNPMSAGTALNLGAGTVRIFWDVWWSWVQYHQACERNNRITRQLPVTSYVLLSAHTIEETMWAAMQNKEDLARLVTDPKARYWRKNRTQEVLDLWQP